MVSKVVRTRRRRAKAEAKVLTVNMTDDDLRSLVSELGRQVNIQSAILNEIRGRHDSAREEQNRRAAEKTYGIRVSEHAVLRYLERHKGVDIEAIRHEIAAMANAARKDKVGPKGTRVLGGIVLGVDEDSQIVTTIMTEAEEQITTLGEWG